MGFGLNRFLAVRLRGVRMLIVWPQQALRRLATAGRRHHRVDIVGLFCCLDTQHPVLGVKRIPLKTFWFLFLAFSKNHGAGSFLKGRTDFRPVPISTGVIVKPQKTILNIVIIYFIPQSSACRCVSSFPANLLI